MTEWNHLEADQGMSHHGEVPTAPLRMDYRALPKRQGIPIVLIRRMARAWHRERDHCRRPGITGVDEYISVLALLVTVTHLPVTRCQICHRTVAYRPGSLSEVLTEHYQRVRPRALGILPGNTPKLPPACTSHEVRRQEVLIPL
jgi:hypothetical protein